MSNLPLKATHLKTEIKIYLSNCNHSKSQTELIVFHFGGKLSKVNINYLGYY